MFSIDFNEFRFLLRKSERSLDKKIGEALEDTSISFIQYHTLMEIEKQNVTNLKELSSALKLDSSTVSRSINILVKAGLVIRAVDQDNRRYIKIAISSKGEEACKKAGEICDHFYRELFSTISEDEHYEVSETIKLLTRTLANGDGT